MAIMYPPYIEGTIPAFGPTLKVPFEWNPGVAPTQVYKMVAKILDLNNDIKATLETSVDYTINKFNEIEFDTTGIGLTSQQYYKVQIAYSDNTEEEIVYSSVGIGKYFGTSNPYFLLEVDINNQNNFVLIYNDYGSKEIPYSCIVDNDKEYYFKSNRDDDEIITYSISFMNIGTSLPQEFLCKTINGYEALADITDEAKNNIITNTNITMVENEINYILTNGYSLKSIDKEKWYPIINNDKDYILETNSPYYYGNRNGNTIEGIQVNLDYEHMSLISSDNKVLNIEFNPKVSSFKTTLQEQKIDTIGGKYPVFQRNGALAYKEFQISGLVSYHSDSNNTFISKNDLGLENKFITTDLIGYNITAERKFRMAVLDWLNNGEIKIFRSPTEGIYLVKIMNVSLTPEDKLGRMLYTFSATAYEVAELNYENLVKYKFATPTEAVDYVL